MLTPLIHFDGQFNRMRLRHELMKETYPDMPNGKGIPLTGLSNARPETLAIGEKIRAVLELLPIDPEKYIESDAPWVVDGDWGN